MKLKDTRINMAGKFRCCAGLGASPDNPDVSENEVSIGEVVECRGCQTEYILVDMNKKHPEWIRVSE